MLKISVISYKSTILRVHRSVLLKYLRFPYQDIKRNIDTPNDMGYPTKFYTGSHCPRNEPIAHIYITILTVSSMICGGVGGGGRVGVVCCFIFHDSVQDCNSMGCSFNLMIF